jgi:malonyl CoA-acyl carrier protein transacylase
MSLKDQVLSSKIFLQFGGQGSPYFNEMIQLYRNEKSLQRYFSIAIEAIKEELERSEVGSSPALPQGLAFWQWLEQEESIPSDEYLNKASVSLPLIGVTQLANYFLFLEKGLGQAELTHITAGATGHSQGLMSAVLAGLALDGEKLYSQAKIFIKYLFYTGLNSQECFGKLENSDQVLKKMAELGDKEISPMAAMIGPEVSELAELVKEFNIDHDTQNIIYLSLYNTRKSNVISGEPMNLLLFKEKFATQIQHYKWKFIPIKTSAPYHCSLLGPSLAKMQMDIKRIQFSCHGSELQFPVYSIHDGRNLQMDQDLSLTIYREMIIETLHWSKAIGALKKNPNIRYVIDFGPGKVSSRLTAEHLLEMPHEAEILCLSIPRDQQKIFG